MNHSCKKGKEMKKLFSIILIIALLVSLVACATTEAEEIAEPEIAPAVEAEPVEEQPAVAEETADVAKNSYLRFDPLKGVVPGVLYQLNLEEGQEPIIRGISLSGNGAGGDKINNREPSVDNIRFVFSINEWIYVVLDTDKTEDLFGFIVAHGNDPVVYDESAFIESLYDSDKPSYSPFWVNENGAVAWDTYVYSTNDPGFFDLVICYEEKPVAMVVLRIYPDEALNDFSDEQLEAFMQEATEEAKQVNL